MEKRNIKNCITESFLNSCIFLLMDTKKSSSKIFIKKIVIHTRMTRDLFKLHITVSENTMSEVKVNIFIVNNIFFIPK